MPAPQVRLGDINSDFAPVIGVKAVRCFTNGRPSSTAGDIVAPHDSKPTHFAVTTTINSKVLIQGVPVTNVGAPDSCFHMRITGSVNVYT
tara:strand:+ start:4997 stop:5266 length:270 start_codon:yes stop_codon:yes gene_type:complete